MRTTTVKTSICPHCNNRHDVRDRPSGHLEFVQHERKSFRGLRKCEGSGEVREHELVDIEYEVERVHDEW